MRELAERALKLRPGMKVTLRSGHTQDVFLKEGVQKATAFLQKPFPPAGLAQGVRETMDAASRSVGQSYSPTPQVGKLRLLSAAFASRPPQISSGAAAPRRPNRGSTMETPVLVTVGRRYGERDGMQTAHTRTAIQVVLERKEAELVQELGTRDGIAIEKSPDQMDEIQYASERDLAILNVDRESTLLREVRAALRRVHDGSFGTCIDCELAISPKRLGAVPWAPRCIQCQDAVDRDGRERAGAVGVLVNAA